MPPVVSDSSCRAYRSSTYWDSTTTATSGHRARRVSAARSPSSEKPGGIRTSTTASSGRYCPTAPSRPSASLTVATTSKPAAPSSLASPSRSSTEASAITTRGAAEAGPPRRVGAAVAVVGDDDLEQPGQRRHADVDPAGPGVLGHVGQRLGDQERRDRLP